MTASASSASATWVPGEWGFITLIASNTPRHCMAIVVEVEKGSVVVATPSSTGISEDGSWVDAAAAAGPDLSVEIAISGSISMGEKARVCFHRAQAAAMQKGASRP